MRRFRVSSFLADVTQQIHSFRAREVISVQRLLAPASDSMALPKSIGSLWTVPPAIFWSSHTSIEPCLFRRTNFGWNFAVIFYGIILPNPLASLAFSR